MFLCMLGGAKAINVSVSSSCKCVQAPLSAALRGLPFRRGGSRPLSIKSLTEKYGSVFIWKRTGLERQALIHRDLSLLFLESFHIPLVLMPIQFPENETRISLYDGIVSWASLHFHRMF